MYENLIYSHVMNNIEFQDLLDYLVFTEQLERKEIAVHQDLRFRLRAKRVNQAFLELSEKKERKVIMVWKESLVTMAKRVKEVCLVLQEFLDPMVLLDLKVFLFV